MCTGNFYGWFRHENLLWWNFETDRMNFGNYSIHVGMPRYKKGWFSIAVQWYLIRLWVGRTRFRFIFQKPSRVQNHEKSWIFFLLESPYRNHDRKNLGHPIYLWNIFFIYPIYENIFTECMKFLWNFLAHYFSLCVR